MTFNFNHICVGDNLQNLHFFTTSVIAFMSLLAVAVLLQTFPIINAFFLQRIQWTLMLNFRIIFKLSLTFVRITSFPGRIYFSFMCHHVWWIVITAARCWHLFLGGTKVLFKNFFIFCLFFLEKISPLHLFATVGSILKLLLTEMPFHLVFRDQLPRYFLIL